DGEVEQDLVGWSWGIEGLVECLLGGVDLLVEELPADLMLPRQRGDGLCPGEGLDGQGLPLRREQSLRRPGAGAGVGTEVRLRGIDERRSLAVHARFLRVWSWD